MTTNEAADTTKSAVQAAADAAKQGVNYVAASVNNLTAYNSNEQNGTSSKSSAKPGTYAEVQAAGLPVSTPGLTDPSSNPVHQNSIDHIQELTRQKQQGLDPAQQGISNNSISGQTTERDVPLNTVESSAAPDVSYEHRPKTLPQLEIDAREKERGQRGAVTGVPSRVVASEFNAGYASEAAKSAEIVHEKDAVERELLSNVTPAQPTIEAQAGVRSGPAAGTGVQPAPGSNPPSQGAIETALKNSSTTEQEDATPGLQAVGGAPSVDPSNPRSGSLANHSLDTLLPPTSAEQGARQAPTVLTDAKPSGSGPTGAIFEKKPVQSQEQTHARQPDHQQEQSHLRQDSETLPKSFSEGSDEKNKRSEEKTSSEKKSEASDQHAPPKQTASAKGTTELENPSAIPIAGGKKIGEDHFGESKKLE